MYLATTNTAMAGDTKLEQLTHTQMSILKKMNKQWWSINKHNIEAIKQERERQATIKFLKELLELTQPNNERRIK